jgi:hypothetical protein
MNIGIDVGGIHGCVVCVSRIRLVTLAGTIAWGYRRQYRPKKKNTYLIVELLQDKTRDSAIVAVNVTDGGDQEQKPCVYYILVDDWKKHHPNKYCCQVDQRLLAPIFGGYIPHLNGERE